MFGEEDEGQDGIGGHQQQGGEFRQKRRSRGDPAQGPVPHPSGTRGVPEGVHGKKHGDGAAKVGRGQFCVGQQVRREGGEGDADGGGQGTVEPSTPERHQEEESGTEEEHRETRLAGDFADLAGVLCDEVVGEGYVLRLLPGRMVFGLELQVQVYEGQGNQFLHQGRSPGVQSEVVPDEVGVARGDEGRLIPGE